MIKDINNFEITKNESLKSQFSFANLREIDQECNILNQEFYLDSFNYFPISSNFNTFSMLFKRDDENSIDHFYTQKFYNNLIDKKNEFKQIKNSFVLGSSAADNYFSNLIHFFPRIFFVNEKKINILIHRNLSNKFRNLIKTICQMREIDVTFNFIDDGFYLFNNSVIPQFFNIKKSVYILKFFFDKILPNVKAPDFGSKIYIRRENANYRKILNEADLIKKLRLNGFEIINPQHFEILVQMKIFYNAKLIISPYGSNLSNIIFCKKGTKIVELSPEFSKPYEKKISTRYKLLSDIVDLDFNKVKVDTVDVDKHSDLTKKHINVKILNNSNYYKNMIVKVGEIDKFINSLQIDN